MLRHYESLELVATSNRIPNGYREYCDADICRIFRIECLRKLGMSLAEVVHALHSNPPMPCNGTKPAERVDEPSAFLGGTIYDE